MFRRTFLPSNTPMQLSQKFYDVYASTHSSKEMNFDDFLEVYYLIHFDSNKAHQSINQKRAQLLFNIFKQHGSAAVRQSTKSDNVMKDSFNSNIFTFVGKEHFKMTDEQCTQFLESNNLQPNQKVTLQRFLQLYDENQNHKLFQWMHEFSIDYKGDQNAQIDLDQIQKQMQIEGLVTPKTKSEINQQLRQNLKNQTEANSPLRALAEDEQEDIMLEPPEMKVLEKFFHEKLVAKHDMKQSFKELEQLFEPFKLPPLLLRRIIESFVLSSETNYFELKTFIQIIAILTKSGDDEESLISYIFDIFSKYKDVIQKGQLLEVIQIFSDQAEEEEVKSSNNQVQPLRKPEFIQQWKRLGMRLHYFTKMNTLFVVEFELKPSNPEGELEAIRLCLDGEPDLKQYILKSLRTAQEGDQYYLLNKKFWLCWMAYVGLKEKDAFGAVTNQNTVNDKKKIQARKPYSLMNEQLKRTPGSNHLNPNIIYWKDYVVVPPRVWKAFVNWYGKSPTIMRKVIQFPHDLVHLRTSVQLVASDTGAGAAIQNQIQKGYEQLMYIDQETNQVTELEIEEVYLKCGMIQENGKLPNQVKDGFFSRKATLQQVLDQLVNAFENKETKDQKSKEFRLWDRPDGPQDNNNLEQSIEEAGLKGGQNVYIEFKLESGEWPSNKQLVTERESSKTKGLANIGNTCFMNASLQCIVNSPYVREYFTGTLTPNGLNQSIRISKDKRQQINGEPLWRKQMNPNNVMGQRGDFVKPFAETVEKMWDTGAYLPVYPWGFKRALGRVNPQFQGYRQHDAHEFIATTLSTLHEEVSVRQKKPYIVNPECRLDKLETSYEFWSNYLRRDWSFFTFMFYGQIKSTTECQQCFNKKVHFDPCSVISLPVPNQNNLQLPVIVNSLPTELYKILNDQLDITVGLLNLNNQSNKERMKSVMISENTDSFIANQKRQKAIHVHVNIDQQDTVGNLVKKLHNMNGLNLLGKVKVDDQEIELTKLVIYVLKDARKQNITLLFEDQRTFADIGVIDKQAIVATEVLTEAAKQLIQKHYQENELIPESMPTQTKLKSTLLMRTRVDYSNNMNISTVSEMQINSQMQTSQRINQSTDGTVMIDTNSNTLSTQSAKSQRKHKKKTGVLNPYQYFNICYKNNAPTCDILPNYEPPSELIIMIINRKLIMREQNQKLLKRHDPVAFANEFPILATESSSGREIYEQVWMRVRSLLQVSVYDRQLLWWNQCEHTDQLNQSQNVQLKKTLSPFVLKHVEFTGTSCSICHWSKKCHGCIIQPSEIDAEQLRKILLRHTYIACDWDIDFFDSYSDPQSMNWQEHDSVQQVQVELDKPHKLQDCFQLYRKVDILKLNCQNCNSSRPNKKHMEINTSPPVLIIHLKRFKIMAYQQLKIQDMITFPLYDLDISEYVSFHKPGMCYEYDLFGIVNHYGTLTGGHYTSVIKNERTGDWNTYDDSNAKSIKEDQVQTKAAFILFYRRKDLTEKSMSDVIPKLNVTKFPGMPVKLKSGKLAYLIDYREGHPCPYKVGLGLNTVLYLSEESIVPDTDSEDLSAINNMIRKKWKATAAEEFTAKGGKEEQAAKEKAKGSSNKKDKKGKKAKDSEPCTIF